MLRGVLGGGILARAPGENQAGAAGRPTEAKSDASCDGDGYAGARSRACRRLSAPLGGACAQGVSMGSVTRLS